MTYTVVVMEKLSDCGGGGVVAEEVEVEEVVMEVRVWKAEAMTVKMEVEEVVEAEEGCFLQVAGRAAALARSNFM